jgi:hypothetical protein
MLDDMHAGLGFHSLISNLLALVLIGVLVLTGCDLMDAEDEDEEEGPIAAIAISPDSVSLAVGEQVDFSVVALTASGDTARDADLAIRWWSTDSTVFTVEEDGLATGRGSGTAFCMVEATDEATGKRAGKAVDPSRPHFTGRDSAIVHLF